MLVQNEFFDLLVQEEKVLIRTKKIGYPLKSFDKITREYPRIKIQSFPALRKALTEPGAEASIARWLPIVEIAVSADKMSAQYIINETQSEITDNKQKFIQLINEALDEKAIIHGRTNLEEAILASSVPGDAAIATKPQVGADAIIKYIEIPEKKPVIREDGSADYYEMNFVTAVNEGEWLGEKIPAQDGVEGIDVFGNSIAAEKGLDRTLEYDKKAISEVFENGKIVLRAQFGGALQQTNGVLSIGKQLVVTGDVGPETGSITFDGSVLVMGTVLAGFSINATGDISIEGNEGVTNSRVIQSSEGDVYIKGGIFGGGESVIEAYGNIYIKHANNCKLYAKEVHAGLYILGSDVIAEHVILDKSRGKIIGGHIEAQFTIECAIAGNTHERTTTLQAKGIDKDRLLSEIQAMAKDLKERQEVITKLETHVKQFTQTGGPTNSQQKMALLKMKTTIDTNRKEILELDEEIQLDLKKLKTTVPTKIEVTREAHAGTIIQIGSKSSTLHKATKGTFAVVDGVLNV